MTLLQKILSVATVLLAVQIQPALSFEYSQTAPAFNNFINQQQQLCTQRHGIFMQGQCLSPSKACRINPSTCTPPGQTQLLPHTTPGTGKLPCNSPAPTDGVPADCIPPVQISMADCRLQGSQLVCFVEPRTEITPSGAVQRTPLMPPQGFEIKEASLEGVFKPGILVLPNMCTQSGNDWYCQIPTTGQQIVIRAKVAN